MYEKNFGIAAPAFQLTPDPDFYFESEGHRQAALDLKLGLSRACGFVVISGAIGAGKTTLIRAVLSKIDASEIAVAQVLSTQLNAEELLRAVIFAFGLEAPSRSVAGSLDSIQQFLGQLFSQRRHALLVIDEAQHLTPDAFEQLANLGIQNKTGHARIQICFVGQPELKTYFGLHVQPHIAGHPCIFCHLKPMNRDEVRFYIEHRLRKVGWTGVPCFTSESFEEIFRFTDGVPRLINQLCNRLMLKCFLITRTEIDALTVASCADEWRLEMAGAQGNQFVAEGVTSFVSEEVSPVSETLRLHAGRTANVGSRTVARPLICVVGGYGDHIKAGPLMRAMAGRAEWPRPILVRAYSNTALEVHNDMLPGLEVTKGAIHLEIGEGTRAEQSDSLTKKFEEIIDQHYPLAVFVMDGSEAALACGLVTHRRQIPLVQVGAGLRVSGGSGAADMTRKLTDSMADLLYTCDSRAESVLAQEGIALPRIHCVGTLLVDALQDVLRKMSAGEICVTHPLSVRTLLTHGHGYGLVVLSNFDNCSERQCLTELLTSVRNLSCDLPLVWPMQPHIARQIEKFRLTSLIETKQITRIPLQGYAPYIDLIRNARCVLTDSWNVQEEAQVLGITCLVMGAYPLPASMAMHNASIWVGNDSALAVRALWNCMFNVIPKGPACTLWDGKTAERIVAHWVTWVHQTALNPAEFLRFERDRRAAPVS